MIYGLYVVLRIYNYAYIMICIAVMYFPDNYCYPKSENDVRSQVALDNQNLRNGLPESDYKMLIKVRHLI